MDSKKVLFFLDLLNRETSGHRDEIANLYQRALEEDDDVVRLKMLLNDYSYYRELGKSLYDNGVEVMDKICSNPSFSVRSALWKAPSSRLSSPLR